MPTYLQVPFFMPANNQVVWCRTERWTGAPFLATYKTASDTFTSVDNTLVYPFYMITYWRAQ